MLGQVCHAKYFSSAQSRYQEVNPHIRLLLTSQAFVLHARHATCYLFYARFPNDYLQGIVQYGAKYAAEALNPHTIILHQSRPFRMRYVDEQAAFFTLLANLFNYMVSGNSHIGVLNRGFWNVNSLSSDEILMLLGSTNV